MRGQRGREEDGKDGRHDGEEGGGHGGSWASPTLAPSILPTPTTPIMGSLDDGSFDDVAAVFDDLDSFLLSADAADTDAYHGTGQHVDCEGDCDGDGDGDGDGSKKGSGRGCVGPGGIRSEDHGDDNHRDNALGEAAERTFRGCGSFSSQQTPLRTRQSSLSPSTPTATAATASASDAFSKQTSHSKGKQLLFNPTRNTYAPMNAVHMELQENAKIPTFNMNVDRSNSTNSLLHKTITNNLVGTSMKKTSLTSTITTATTTTKMMGQRRERPSVPSHGDDSNGVDSGDAAASCPATANRPKHETPQHGGTVTGSKTANDYQHPHPHRHGHYQHGHYQQHPNNNNKNKMSSCTSHDIEEIMRLSENDLNLTEMFLGKEPRTNAARAYSSAGALLSYIGTRIGVKTSVSGIFSSTGSVSSHDTGSMELMCSDSLAVTSDGDSRTEREEAADGVGDNVKKVIVSATPLTMTLNAQGTSGNRSSQETTTVRVAPSSDHKPKSTQTESSSLPSGVSQSFDSGEPKSKTEQAGHIPQHENQTLHLSLQSGTTQKLHGDKQSVAPSPSPSPGVLHTQKQQPPQPSASVAWNPHLYAYYPYGRPYPLPFNSVPATPSPCAATQPLATTGGTADHKPNSRVSTVPSASTSVESSSPPLSAAIATAAKIACKQVPATSVDSPPVSSPPAVPAPLSSKTIDTTAGRKRAVTVNGSPLAAPAPALANSVSKQLTAPVPSSSSNSATPSAQATASPSAKKAAIADSDKSESASHSSSSSSVIPTRHIGPQDSPAAPAPQALNSSTLQHQKKGSFVLTSEATPKPIVSPNAAGQPKKQQSGQASQQQLEKQESKQASPQQTSPQQTSPQHPAPATTQQQPAPATTQQQPAPVTTQQQPTPVTTQPRPSPVTTQEQPAPVTTQQQPNPVTTQPHPAPVTTQPQPPPVTTQQQPAPVTTQQQLTPVTTDSVTTQHQSTPLPMQQQPATAQHSHYTHLHPHPNTSIYPPPPHAIAAAHPYYHHAHYHHHHFSAPVSYAAAHATPTTSILEATKQRSQFGFGGNHSVPSVPLPPPNPKSHGRDATSATGVNINAVGVPKTGVPAGIASPPALANTGLSGNPPPNTGPAYERKKQRAKDARVKLNESIERLSIAISVAGTQSKQRADQLKSSSSLLQPLSSSKVNDFRPTTIQFMEDCTKAADNAKKWDRPSLVGTAATLIQTLNAQCEALMREMVEWKREEQQRLQQSQCNTSTCFRCEDAKQGKVGLASNDNMRFSTNVVSVALSNGSPPNNHLPASNKKVEKGGITNQSALDTAAGSQPAPKRRKLLVNGFIDSEQKDREISKQEKENEQTQSSSTHPGLSGVGQNYPVQRTEAHGIDPLSDNSASIFSQCSVQRIIASFLEPRSLARCMCVSKSWKNLNVFQGETTWLDLSIRRFGMVNVRRWREKEEFDGTLSLGMLRTYQQMHAANVKPPCRIEGNVQLGEAKIDGIVSAWVSMVERSNGETSRSVKRNRSASDNIRYVGEYTSIPVVELRFLLQNTGYGNGPIVVQDQMVSVDSSTRRRGDQMTEVLSDERFRKVVMSVDGSTVRRHSDVRSKDSNGPRDMVRLRLYDAVILVVYINARGCSTTSKFHNRANFTKILLTMNGTTVPLVIPFVNQMTTSSSKEVPHAQ